MSRIFCVVVKVMLIDTSYDEMKSIGLRVKIALARTFIILIYENLLYYYINANIIESQQLKLSFINIYE